MTPPDAEATSQFTPASIQDLADAVWHALDDMGSGGQSVCLANKARLRVAYEPFADLDDPGLDMPLAEARAILAEVGL